MALNYSFLCVDHFLVWSNFEIADLDLWRSEAYSKFFDFLDEKGGFYYEVGALSYVMITADGV